MSEQRVRPGTMDDAAAALDIWRAAANHLIAIGQPLWRPEQFRIEEIGAHAQVGRLIVGLEDGAVAACMLIDDEDRLFWPEAGSGEALYLHKLAVRRLGSGQWGLHLIEWAMEEAARRGLSALRLDCTDRPALIRLYEGCGFSRVDDAPKILGGVPIHRFERQLPMLSR